MIIFTRICRKQYDMTTWTFEDIHCFYPLFVRCVVRTMCDVFAADASGLPRLSIVTQTIFGSLHPRIRFSPIQAYILAYIFLWILVRYHFVSFQVLFFNLWLVIDIICRQRHKFSNSFFLRSSLNYLIIIYSYLMLRFLIIYFQWYHFFLKGNL